MKITNLNLNAKESVEKLLNKEVSMSYIPPGRKRSKVLTGVIEEVNIYGFYIETDRIYDGDRKIVGISHFFAWRDSWAIVNI